MGLTTDVTIFEAKVCKSIFILHDLLLFTKKQIYIKKNYFQSVLF